MPNRDRPKSPPREPSNAPSRGSRPGRVASTPMPVEEPRPFRRGRKVAKGTVRGHGPLRHEPAAAASRAPRRGPEPREAVPQDADGPVVFDVASLGELAEVRTSRFEAPRPPVKVFAPRGATKVTDVRAGRVAIVGRPNVGKSTLLNVLLGQRLAIATSKPGTTRTILLGVHDSVDDEGRRTQLALLDTPGLETPRSVLGRALVEEAQASFEQVDAFLFLVDVETTVRHQGLDAENTRVLALLRQAAKPIVLVLNKVDRVRDKARLLPLLEKLHEGGIFTALVPVSATRGTGVPGIVSSLREHLGTDLVQGDDAVTDRPERFFAAELVREAILELTREEVPYSTAVQVDEWVEEGNLVRIGFTIIVEKDSQKGIVIGKKGAMLKDIGEKARLGIEDLLGRKVFVRTFVKVVPGWTKDEDKVRRMVREGALP